MSPQNRSRKLDTRGAGAGAGGLAAARSQGQIIIILAIAMVPLLASVGLAVDLGTVILHHRQLQNGVDAAAHAGMQRIAQGIPNGPAPVGYTVADVQAVLNTYVDANVSTFNIVFANLLWGPGPDADDCLKGLLVKTVALAAASTDDLWTAHCLQVKATHNYSTLAAKVLPGLSVLQVDAIATAAATPVQATGNLMPMAVSDGSWTKTDAVAKTPWGPDWSDANLKIKTCAQWAAMKVPHALQPKVASDGTCGGLPAAATRFYLHDAASDIDPGAELEKLADTNQGVLAVSKATNTVAGAPAAGVQVTNGAGSPTVLTWFTKELPAGTINNTPVTAHIRFSESVATAKASPRVKIDRTTSAGAFISQVVDDNCKCESILPLLPPNENPLQWTTGNASATVLLVGDRLKITVYGDDVGGGPLRMAAPGTFTLYYDGLAGATGDTWIDVPMPSISPAVNTDNFKGLLNFSGPPANAAGEPTTWTGASSSTRCHWDNEHNPSETSGTSATDKGGLTASHKDWRGFANPPGLTAYSPFPVPGVTHTGGAYLVHKPWNNQTYRPPTVTADQPLGNDCSTETNSQSNAVPGWVRYGFNGLINTGYPDPADYILAGQPVPTVCPTCGQGDFFTMIGGNLGTNISTAINQGPCFSRPFTYLTVPLFDAFADPMNATVSASSAAKPALHLSHFASFYVACPVANPASSITGYFVAGTAASGAVTGGTRTKDRPTVSVIKFVG